MSQVLHTDRPTLVPMTPVQLASLERLVDLEEFNVLRPYAVVALPDGSYFFANIRIAAPNVTKAPSLGKAFGPLGKYLNLCSSGRGTSVMLLDRGIVAPWFTGSDGREFFIKTVWIAASARFYRAPSQQG